MFGILGFIADIFKPASDLIDDLHTSGEEEGEIAIKLKNLEVSLATLQNEVTLKAMEYEGKLLEAKSSIIMAETNSASWIARNWRPITMLTFLVLVVLDSFNWLPNPLAKEAWTMLQLGLSGYLVGRSAEKVAKVVRG